MYIEITGSNEIQHASVSYDNQIANPPHYDIHYK